MNFHTPGQAPRVPARRRPRRSKPPVVALLIETSNAYSRKLLRGVRAYLQEHGPWSIQLGEQARGNRPPSWLHQWRGDGILARVETEEIAAAVRATGVPVVNVSATRFCPEFPQVISDSNEIARLAFEHLRDRGYRRFAYCGDPRFAWSERHGENFVGHVNSIGARCAVFRERPATRLNPERERRELARWLTSLPRPVGIMACYDVRGQQVLDVCRQHGIRVPDEVAVIGQHNDDLLCDLCDPPLTSVIPNAEKSGHDAATLLDRMMCGKKVRPAVLQTAPIGVATRLSTDMVAVNDERIGRVLRLVHAHATAALTVDDMLAAEPMSRTHLEVRFKELLGCTPYQYVLRVRLQRVKRLLLEPDISIARVAERCGFENPEYLNVLFKRATGLTPGQFRKQHLRGEPG